jgi:hypothetical protein
MPFAEFISQIRWRPGIGDASFMGWFTVAAYAAAGVFCWIAARRSDFVDDPILARRYRRVWTGVAALMALLCVNKQLDLQSLVTDLGRVLARSEGWYGERRAVQRVFVLVLAASGCAAFAVLVWKTHSTLPESTLLLCGLSFLLNFIMVRAASFHHFDMFLKSRRWGVRANWALELGGIGLVAFSAARFALRYQDR